MQISTLLTIILVFGLICVVVIYVLKLNGKIRRLQKALKKSIENNTRFTFFFEHAPMPLAVMNIDGSTPLINQCFTDTFGYTEKDISSLEAWWPLAYPDPIYRSRMQQVWEKNVFIEAENNKGNEIKGGKVSITCKNGEIRQIVLNTQMIDNNMMVIFFDVTDLTQIQRELEKSLERFQTLFDLLPISTAIFDMTRRFLMVNQYFRDSMQMSNSELIGQTPDTLGVKIDPAQSDKIRSELLEKGAVKEFELSYELRGCEKCDLIYGCPIDWFGEPAMLSSSIDILERKQRERALQFTQFSFDQAAIGIYHIASDGQILNVNQHAADLLGYSKEELSGLSVFDIDPSAKNKEWEEFRPILGEKGSHTFETIHRRKSGKEVPVEISASLLEYEGEEFCVCFVQNITDRKKAKLALQESEARFEALHNASFGGIVIHDKGIILECNQGLADLTGYSVSELMGMNGLSLISEKSWDVVNRNIESDYEKPYEGIGIRKNGDEFPIRMEGRTVPYKGKRVRVTEFRDITDQKLAEEQHEKLRTQLIQSQKMEAIGTLAGGIAHDFNNILSALMGFTELAKMRSAGNEKVINYLEKVSSAALRARDLVAQILTFSRKTNIEKRVMNIHPIIKETIKFMRASLPSNIEIRQDLKTNKSRIFGDPTHIHQLFMNLFTNAGYAMKDRGGVLQVTLDVVTINENDKINFKEISIGSYLQIIVSDTGCGIPKPVIDKVFEPFFTTKERGEGTGMGLSTVYGIVKEMDGSISVYSEEGVGTTFRILVPEQKSASDKTEFVLNTPLLTGEGKILFVDDERSIVEGTVELLSNLGYEVAGMVNSIEALEKIKADPNYFDLILTDLTMPGMSGLELSKEIKKLNPDLPIILCTGFNQGLTKEICESAGIMKMVMKPLTFSQLSDTVYNALNIGDSENKR